MGTPPCGVGLSTDPDGARAAAVAVRQAIAGADGRADVVLLLASAAHADPRVVVGGAQEVAGETRVVGCGAAGVLSGVGEVEDGPGVVALALPDDPEVRARPFLCLPHDGGIGGLPDELPARGLALVFADGYSEHPDRVARSLRGVLPPGLAVAGSISTSTDGPYPAYRWLDGEISARAASGLLIETRVDPIVGVTQGSRPIGATHVVTEAEGPVVATLDGRPAFEVFAEVARPLLHDLQRAAQAIFVALPASGAALGDDDYVVRGILRFDPDRGLLQLSEEVAPGTELRFTAREPWAAREDLRQMIARVARRLEGRTPRCGLYLCNAGRGRALFGIEDHDVAFIQGALGRFPLVGMFGGGELGPAGGGARFHLFSGVLVLLP